MSESTLALEFDDLMRLTAERVGYGHRADTSEGLSAGEETEIDNYVQEGYRKFLQAYKWSFLEPVVTATLFGDITGTMSGDPTYSSGTSRVKTTADTFYPTVVGRYLAFTTSGTSYEIVEYTSATEISLDGNASNETDDDTFTITADGGYRMPDDFGGLLSDVYFGSGAGHWPALINTGVAEILDRLQSVSGAGRPTMCAIQPLVVSGEVGQRFDLLTWRIPEAVYTVKFRYLVLPNKLKSGKYPYGSVLHAETLKWACYSAAEISKKETARGPASISYGEMLAQSVRNDQRIGRAESLGIMANTDGSGESGPPLATNITAGGVSYPS